MINISIDGSAIKFVFEGSSRYLYGDGVIQAPINSLSLILDKSDLITLVKASSNDPFISFLVAESNFASKDEFVSWFKSNAVSAGGGGGGTVTIDPTLDSGSTNPVANSAITDAIDDLWDEKADKDDVYTKDEVDAGFSSVTSSVTAINSSLTAHTADTGIHTTTAEKEVWNAKQTALTAGTGIDITNNVISVTASTGGSNVVELTQAQYEALTTKDPDVLYVITDAPEISISGKADTSAVTAVNDALTAHTANTNIHTTAQEKSTWTGKQDALVSGTNIKTINNQSLLGSGNIDIQGGGTDTGTVQTMIEDYCDPKEEVIATALNDLNDRVEDLESGGSSVTIATAITSSSTNDEAAGALATYNAITAATTGGGATYSAGQGISINTANTISFGVPIYSGKTGTILKPTYNNNSITMGQSTNFASITSFAGGGSCTGTNYSFVYGSNNNATGNTSIALGNRLNAINDREAAFGQFNVSNKTNTTFGDSGNTLFSVGNGTSSAGHNAFEIRQNGDIYCSNGTSDVKLQDYLQVKVVKISQSDYDALVQGGTVDSNTLYIVSNVVS